MKPILGDLRRGQEIWAIVEENLEAGEMVVNFSGDLIRVGNETSKIFRCGQRVLLKVESTSPLAFKLIAPAAGHRQSRRSLDVNI